MVKDRTWALMDWIDIRIKGDIILYLTTFLFLAETKDKRNITTHPYEVGVCDKYQQYLYLIVCCTDGKTMFLSGKSNMNN